MKKQIEAFKQYLIVDKKSSKNTVESYVRDLLQFSDFCSSLKINSVQKVKTATINSYLEYLTNEKKSDATKAIAVKLHSFNHGVCLLLWAFVFSIYYLVSFPLPFLPEI